MPRSTKNNLPSQTLATVLREVEGLVQRIPGPALDSLGRRILEAPRLFVYGAGRSGLAARGLAMRLAQSGREAYVIGETTTPPVKRGDLILIVSASGETPSAIAIAKAARRNGARIALVTARATSSIARLAHHKLLVPAPSKISGRDTASSAQPRGPRPSAQPTASLFEQTVWLLFDAIVLSWIERSPSRHRRRLDRGHANLE